MDIKEIIEEAVKKVKAKKALKPSGELYKFIAGKIAKGPQEIAEFRNFILKSIPKNKTAEFNVILAKSIPTKMGGLKLQDWVRYPAALFYVDKKNKSIDVQSIERAQKDKWAKKILSTVKKSDSIPVAFEKIKKAIRKEETIGNKLTSSQINYAIFFKQAAEKMSKIKDPKKLLGLWIDDIEEQESRASDKEAFKKKITVLANKIRKYAQSYNAKDIFFLAQKQESPLPSTLDKIADRAIGDIFASAQVALKGPEAIASETRKTIKARKAEKYKKETGKIYKTKAETNTRRSQIEAIIKRAKEKAAMSFMKMNDIIAPGAVKLSDITSDPDFKALSTKSQKEVIDLFNQSIESKVMTRDEVKDIIRSLGLRRETAGYKGKKLAKKLSTAPAPAQKIAKVKEAQAYFQKLIDLGQLRLNKKYLSDILVNKFDYSKDFADKTIDSLFRQLGPQEEDALELFKQMNEGEINIDLGASIDNDNDGKITEYELRNFINRSKDIPTEIAFPQGLNKEKMELAKRCFDMMLQAADEQILSSDSKEARAAKIIEIFKNCAREVWPEYNNIDSDYFSDKKFYVYYKRNDRPIMIGGEYLCGETEEEAHKKCKIYLARMAHISPNDLTIKKQNDLGRL